ncbi:MAG: prepilin-type N-terminal cleavage/methylation domain-containing protein [Thermodesulfobacteriota bacterium]
MIISSKKEKGFTLVEVLIAVFITSVALIALASLAGTAIKATEAGKKRTQAVSLATQKLEMLKKVPYSKIQDTDTTVVVTELQRTCVQSGTVFTCTPTSATDTLGTPGMPGTTSFTWKWKATYVDLDNDACFFAASPCGAGPVIDDGDMKKIDVEVTWIDLLGSHTLTLSMLRGI